ncbi:MAG TPA: ACT domain-containing protein [Gemmatimonadaceae bacterium]
MATRQQLSVIMDNVPGTLATMCSAFAEKDVNIIAFTSSSEQAGKSLVRVVVDKVEAAKNVLQAIGYAYTEEQILATELPNSPGALATVAKTLGDADVNIDYAYVGAEAESSQLLAVLSVSDLGRAKQLVK